MLINLNDLNYKSKIEIDSVFEFPKEIYQNSDINDLKDIKVNGYIYLSEINEYMANIDVEGIMVLKDSNTLESVDYHFSFTYDEKIEESLINNQNMLDIIEFLWENIVLEEPISYSKSDINIKSGDNWQVVDNIKNDDEIDPRMQKLYDYYNKGGE